MVDDQSPGDRVDVSTLLDDIAMHFRWPIPPEMLPSNVGSGGGIGADAIWDLALLPASVPRHSHSLIYDSRRDRLVFFGGADNRDGVPYTFFNDVWELSLANPDAWRRMEVRGTPPSPRAFPAAIYDPVRDRMIVTGGAHIFTYYDDVWALSFEGTPTWTQLHPSMPFGGPQPRGFHVTVYDPMRDRLILHGGVGMFDRFSDAWELSLAGNPVWRRLTVLGPRLFGHTAVYDPVHDEVVAYGGWGDNFNGYIPVNKSFKLALGAVPPRWSEVTPVVSPPIPYGHQGIYDPGNRRMVVWQTGWAEWIWGTWQLSLDGGPFVWSQVLTRGEIGPRSFQTAVYDPVRHRMIVHGGQNQFPIGETHALSFCVPVRLDVRPGDENNAIPLHSHGAVPVAILSAPGFDATSVDLATVRFAEAAPAAHPHARFEDVDGDALLDLLLNFRIDDLRLGTADTIATVTLTFAGGGLGCGEDRIRVVPPVHADEMIESAWSAPVEDAMAMRVRSGPRSRGFEVELSLPHAGSATLEVLDVSGRRIGSHSLESLPAGRRVVALAETESVPAGLYFLRLTQGDRRASAKVLRIP